MRRSIAYGLMVGAGCLVVWLLVLVLNPAMQAAPMQETPEAEVFLPYVERAVLPTATFTPTPTPTPSPTVEPSVHVLDNHFAFEDDLFGDLVIVGEVQNGLAENVSNVKVSVVVYDVHGTVVDTDIDYIDMDMLAPGDKTCFRIWFLGGPSDWAYYEFEAPTYYIGGDDVPMTIVGDHGNYVGGNYEILGQVRNDYTFTVSWVEVVATLYRADGTVVDCDMDTPNSTTLEPGQLSAFKVVASLRDYADVTSYRLQSDGDP